MRFRDPVKELLPLELAGTILTQGCQISWDLGPILRQLHERSNKLLQFLLPLSFL